MKRIFNIITSILAYWAPLTIGVLMIVAAFPLKNISLGISGALIVGIASLFRLFLNAAGNIPNIPLQQSNKAHLANLDIND